MWLKFVSDLRQIVGFLLGTPDSSTNKTDRHDIIEMLLKVALNTVDHRPKELWNIVESAVKHHIHNTYPKELCCKHLHTLYFNNNLSFKLLYK